MTAVVVAIAAGGNVGGPSVSNMSVNTRPASSLTMAATTAQTASASAVEPTTSSVSTGRLPKAAKPKSVNAHASASQNRISHTNRNDGGKLMKTFAAC